MSETLMSIDEILKETYVDFKLSRGEKSALRDLFGNYADQPESLNYIRNRCFELAKEHFRNSSASHYETLKWLEGIVKTLDTIRESNDYTVEVCFSPGQACVDKVVSLCCHARGSIDVCVFTISDNRISSELIAAHKRNVRVRVITDNDKSEDLGSDVDEMVRSGIEVKMDKSEHHMHHKFAIFDNQFLVNGSFNWTRSASRYNQENLVVSTDERLIEQFYTVFQQLWNQY